MPSIYDKEFYDRIGGPSLRSAHTIAPFVAGIIKPCSVIDFGCGAGSWLKAFAECDGVKDIQGLEFGDIEESTVFIDQEKIRKFDLTRPYSSPRRYDLAISLEVAEHIPAEFATTVVDSLVSASDIVLFSAAIPNQAGRNHINLQFPSYWAKLFAKHNYRVLDLIRPKFWDNKDVEVWYRQNMLIFASEEALKSGAVPSCDENTPPPPLLDVIHPEMGDKFVSDLKDRIAQLHETYKNRLKEAREETWEKARNRKNESATRD